MSKLAGWISILFDSSVLSLFVFPAIGWRAAGWAGVAWAFVALLILTGIPLAYILIGIRSGWVSDMELSKREQRPRFILVSFSSDLLGLLILWLGGAPHQIWVLALIYASLGVDNVHNFELLEDQPAHGRRERFLGPADSHIWAGCLVDAPKPASGCLGAPAAA